MKKKKFRPKSSEGPFSLPLAHICLVIPEWAWNREDSDAGMRIVFQEG